MGKAMNQDRARWQKICAIAILFMSAAIGVTPAAHAQNVPTQRSNSVQKSAANLLRRGQEKMQRQDYRGAISDFNAAIAQNPNNADVYYQRGLLLFELGDELGALWDFDDTLLRNPRHAQAYLHRAGLRLNLGLRSGAMQDLQLAAKLFSEQGDRLGYQKAQNLIRHFNLES